jgi:hypothetical protein
LVGFVDLEVIRILIPIFWLMDICPVDRIDPTIKTNVLARSE